MISKTMPDRMVLTANKGIININDLLPGDFVYEWKTSRQLEVKEIRYMPYKTMWQIEYSDGRSVIITDINKIYLETDKLPPHHPVCRCLKTKDFPITLYPIDFIGNKVYRPLDPDPYVAGALMMYGDQEDPFLNYPMDRKEANNQFSHMYNVDYYRYDQVGKAYFKWKETDHKITWREFFPTYQFRAVDKTVTNLVPAEYEFASLRDRAQFIRGAFDMGYSKINSPYNVALYNDDYTKLEYMKRLINSIGIPAEIVIEPNTYRLDVIGILDAWPGFFYHNDYICQMINNSIGKDFHKYFTDNRKRFATVTVVDAKLLGCPRYTRNPIPQLVLEEPEMVYYSSNYLPILSI